MLEILSKRARAHRTLSRTKRRGSIASLRARAQGPARFLVQGGEGAAGTRRAARLSAVREATARRCCTRRSTPSSRRSAQDARKFKAPRSLRDVEPSVNLWLKRLDGIEVELPAEGTTSDAARRSAATRKPHGQIRQSQIVTTFGPGAMVDLPDHAVIVAGLDHWTGYRSNPIDEDRLAAKVEDAARACRHRVLCAAARQGRSDRGRHGRHRVAVSRVVRRPVRGEDPRLACGRGRSCIGSISTRDQLYRARREAIQGRAGPLRPGVHARARQRHRLARVRPRQRGQVPAPALARRARDQRRPDRHHDSLRVRQVQGALGRDEARRRAARLLQRAAAVARQQREGTVRRAATERRRSPIGCSSVRVECVFRADASVISIPEPGGAVTAGRRGGLGGFPAVRRVRS